ncbi:MAG: hypothetical protein JRI71_13835 [Deltaproteobacteria bacterium]|nr:hypothetical protein [Deltaproteobacteria bacterium]
MQARNNHLRLRVRQRGITFDCIAFGQAPFHPLNGTLVDILFRIGTNRWQGIDSIQLTVVDIKVN